jgi:hypothetical protein
MGTRTATHPVPLPPDCQLTLNELVLTMIAMMDSLELQLDDLRVTHRSSNTEILIGRVRAPGTTRFQVRAQTHAPERFQLIALGYSDGDDLEWVFPRGFTATQPELPLQIDPHREGEGSPLSPRSAPGPLPSNFIPVLGGPEEGLVSFVDLPVTCDPSPVT